MAPKRNKRKLSSHLKEYEAVDFQTSLNSCDFLARGGFAAVRRCQHKQFGTVVVKGFKIYENDEERKNAMTTFEAEANNLSRLLHDNIVKILGVVKWESYTGIVLEYADGGNLRDLLKDTEVFIAWSVRLYIAHQISKALQYCHEKKLPGFVCHGDLKPSNILLTKLVQVKLADFGASRLDLAEGQSVSFDVKCTKELTWRYAAPELVNNSAMKKTTSMDMYSFSMVLYEIITRSPPFENCTADEIRSLKTKPSETPSIKGTDFSSLSMTESEIFVVLNRIKEKCCVHDENARQTSAQVESELQDCKEKLSVPSLNSELQKLSSIISKKYDATLSQEDAVLLSEPDLKFTADITFSSSSGEGIESEEEANKGISKETTEQGATNDMRYFLSVSKW